MTYLPILKLGVTKYKNAEMSIATQNVIKMMTGNEHFPTLQEKVAELEAAHTLFLNSILPPDAQSQVTRDLLKLNRKKLNTQYKALGNLVMGIAEENIETLLSSGYKCREKHVNHPVPGVPQKVEVYVTNTSGVVVVACEKIEGAANYLARFSTDKVNWNWSNFANGLKVMVENVPTNQLMYVQMCTKNPAGQSKWSNVVETYLPSNDLPSVKRMNVSNSMA